MRDLAAAIRIRDRVVPVIRERGRPVQSLLSPGVPILTMRAGGCVVKLTEPFRPSGDGLPEAPTAARPGPLLHRLIIHAKITWHFGPRLLADWDEAGAMTVHEFTRGPWENDLLASLLPPLLPPAKPHEVQNG